MTLFDDPADRERSRATPFHVRALRAGVALFMFAIMAVMFTDVVGRYLFDAPIQGGFEIIAYLLGFLIFSGFPLVTGAQDHITVGLLDAAFRGRARWLRDLLVLVVSVVAVGFIARRMWDQAVLLEADATVGQTFDLEIAPFVYVFAALSAVAFVLILARLWSFVRAGPPDGDGAAP
jgi:TRAP-type C4-dicarboxylate transport system permease small subunit